MSRIVYVNGEFVAEENAVISVFDRGFLFADAVYEVSSVLACLLYTSPSPRDRQKSRMPSSA